MRTALVRFALYRRAVLVLSDGFIHGYMYLVSIVYRYGSYCDELVFEL